MKRDFDFSKDIGVKASTLIVTADADIGTSSRDLAI